MNLCQRHLRAPKVKVDIVYCVSGRTVFNLLTPGRFDHVRIPCGSYVKTYAGYDVDECSMRTIRAMVNDALTNLEDLHVPHGQFVQLLEPAHHHLAN